MVMMKTEKKPNFLVRFFRREKLLFQKDDKIAYLFALPYVLLFMTFILIPIFLAMIL